MICEQEKVNKCIKQVNVLSNFQINPKFEKILPEHLRAPSGYPLDEIFFNRISLGKKDLLISEGYMIRIQKIYTLPLSESELCGVNWVRMENFALIFAEKWVFLPSPGGSN